MKLKRFNSSAELYSSALPLLAAILMWLFSVFAIDVNGGSSPVFFKDILFSSVNCGESSVAFPLFMRIAMTGSFLLFLSGSFLSWFHFYKSACVCGIAGGILIFAAPQLTGGLAAGLQSAGVSGASFSINLLFYLAAAAGCFGAVSAMMCMEKSRSIILKYWKRSVALILSIGALCVMFSQAYSIRLTGVSGEQSVLNFSTFGVLTNRFAIEDTVLSFPLLPKLMILFAMAGIIAGAATVFFRKYELAAVLFACSFVAMLVFMLSSSTLETEVTNIIASSQVLKGAEYATGAGVTMPLVLLPAAAFFAVWSKDAEALGHGIFLVSSFISILSVLVITAYMLFSGIPAMKEIGFWEFITGTSWVPNKNEFGIAPMIMTTIYATIGAILIGVPIGLFTAVFLAELAPKWLCGIVRPAIELLAGIPSVIYGFFGMLVIVPFLTDAFNLVQGKGLAAVIIILAIMILPTIVTTAETGMRAVPDSYREASLALGATKITTIFKAVIPAASSAIVSGVILGVGRALGETMAVIMVAGNVVNMPALFESVRPMTAGIALEMSYAGGLHAQALFAIGLILFIFIMIVNICFSAVSKRSVSVDEQ